ncbi:MAG: DUF4435 domain-containing protein [Butyrivibrio sp.]|nr:DUF4435 domain-containing protein [Butyrivibrio sp.]
MNNLDLLREGRKRGTTAYMKFLSSYKDNKEKLFCFYEGEDSKYYELRWRENTTWDEDDIIFYPCDGKKGIMYVHSKLSNDERFNDIKITYFIDRDFVPLEKKPDDVYETPCYSIENFYTTHKAFKRLLKSEFQINTIDPDFIMIYEDYKKRLKEFHENTLIFNAWLKCIRMNESESEVERVSVTNFKISHCLNDVKIDEQITLKIDNWTDYIKTNFPDAKQFEDFEIEECAKSISENESCMQQMFRGKFEIEFLGLIIKDLYEKYKNNLYFNDKPKRVYIRQPGKEVLSTYSQFADTPQTLIEFMKKYDCESISELNVEKNG